MLFILILRVIKIDIMERLKITRYLILLDLVRFSLSNF